MGKHEREVIEQVEVSVAELLMKRPATLPREHPWEGHDVALAERIQVDYPLLSNAVAIGHRYDTHGDLALDVHGLDKLVYVELKVSASKAAKGTLANVGQDALTKQRVSAAEPWSCWRERHHYKDDITELLDGFEPARHCRTIEDKGYAVKGAAEAGDPAARAVREAVVVRANEDRRGYALEIRNNEIDVVRLRAFSLALLMGAHTEEAIRETLAMGVPTRPEDVPANYGVYYTNKRNGETTVTKRGRDFITSLLSLTDWRIDIADESQGENRRIGAKILGTDDTGAVEILTFIFHWKNVFIGIKTPCINVFLGRHTRSLLS